MSHSYVYRDAIICVTWLIHLFGQDTKLLDLRAVRCDEWHDSYLYMTWAIRIRVPWCNHTCDTTHLTVHTRHKVAGPQWSQVRWLTWLIHVHDKNYSYTCNMTQSYVWHDSLKGSNKTQSCWISVESGVICDMTWLSHLFRQGAQLLDLGGGRCDAHDAVVWGVYLRRRPPKWWHCVPVCRLMRISLI